MATFSVFRLLATFGCLTFGCLPLVIACAAPQEPAAGVLVIPRPASASPPTQLPPESVPTLEPAHSAPAAPREEPALPGQEPPLVPPVSRADAAAAIAPANEGDRSVKVNVEGAIERYTQALQLDPGNAKIAYKLAQAYQRKEDWERMAKAAATAAVLAPSVAQYRFKWGYALVKLAGAGDRDSYDEAEAVLRTCVQIEPTHAECHFFLGEAAEYTLDDQLALESYTRAIEADPDVAYFYPSLARLYIVHKRYREAAQTLAEGTRRIAPTESNAESLYAMYILQFQVAQAKGDDLAMLDAMERAQAVAGDAHPEIAFNLGATYAALEPPQKEKAIRLLTSFTKRACRSAKAARYREQCYLASELLQKLGGP